MFRYCSSILLICLVIQLLACSEVGIEESTAREIAYEWAEQRDIFEPLDGSAYTIIRETDVQSNDNYFVVMFRCELLPEFDGPSHGLHVIVQRSSGDIVYVGGRSASLFDEQFPRADNSLGETAHYYEGIDLGLNLVSDQGT